MVTLPACTTQHCDLFSYQSFLTIFLSVCVTLQPQSTVDLPLPLSSQPGSTSSSAGTSPLTSTGRWSRLLCTRMAARSIVGQILLTGCLERTELPVSSILNILTYNTLCMKSLGDAISLVILLLSGFPPALWHNIL